MSIGIVFETHALSEDNERGVATGWLPGPPRPARPRQRGGRWAGDDATTASPPCSPPICAAPRDSGDRLCGDRHSRPVRLAAAGVRFRRPQRHPGRAVGQDREEYLERPYPGGESRREAVQRVTGLLDDLPTRWAGRRVLLIGHVATQHALEHVINGLALEDLVAADFDWREEGWEYRLG